MKPETLSLICSPDAHEPLQLVDTQVADGSTQQGLVGIHSGEIFPIRDGIPLLLGKTKISGYNQQYQGIYNRIAGFYDGSIKLFTNLGGSGEKAFREEYLQELDIWEDCRFLEVSIGTGANLHYLPVNVACFGLDLSWGMLKKCQRNLEKWQKEAELILGNAEELPLMDESFDAVLHVGGINAFNDREKAIREMIRVARTGAKIVIVDESLKLMEALAWLPGVRKWLQEHAERFSAPVGLVPDGMKEIRATEIAKGKLYCLTFRKP